MSGHSKWATTKHKKAAIDAKRAKSFAKLIKNIEVAAKLGGPDPLGNPTLADAVQKAKKSSVPNENIDRAIKRGGGLSGEVIDYQTILYEGYGPGGVAMLIECLTDNKNRAAAEVRVIMSKHGGTMADPGSVSYNFARKGIVSVPKASNFTEDDLLVAVLDSGAEQVLEKLENFEVVTELSELVATRSAIQGAGFDYDAAEPHFVADVKVEVEALIGKKIIKLVSSLEESDDVQNVYTNYEPPSEIQKEVEEAG